MIEKMKKDSLLIQLTSTQRVKKIPKINTQLSTSTIG